MTPYMKQPKRRSELRLALGKRWFGLRRRMLWLRRRGTFARTFSSEPLPYTYFSHSTPLLRRLKNLDMWMQENKVKNLSIAVKRLDGVLLRPGETFSYWRLIGRTTRRKGYVEGMLLKNGEIVPGVGGGLCQLSNLIYWMTLHTPLTVTERHRHGYDVFPDSNRTQPFGSGATCFYPYVDLMIRNDTSDTYQLRVRVGETDLEGSWRVSAPPKYTFSVVERDHEMRGEFWGGFTRHNALYRQRYTLDGQLLDEELAARNSAVMMYSPFLDSENSPQ